MVAVQARALAQRWVPEQVLGPESVRALGQPLMVPAQGQV
tara:strand:- start:242 stop:361 length:120 start_codon:yes stop_codon:yes gene_type:complete